MNPLYWTPSKEGIFCITVMSTKRNTLNCTDKESDQKPLRHEKQPFVRKAFPFGILFDKIQKEQCNPKYFKQTTKQI